MTSLGFDTGLALTQRPSGGAAGPVAPIPANLRFLIYGDSRTADGKTTTNTTNGLIQGTQNLGYAPWLELLSAYKLRIARNANFTVPASTTYQGAALPRQNANGVATAGDAWRSEGAVNFSDNKGADFANAHEAGISILLYGTNDQIVSDAGYLAASRTNILTILNTAPNKVWIICNELPKGVNDNGTLGGQSVTANFKSFSDWLLTLDYASGHANARANVIVIDTWGEFVDAASGTLYRNKQGYLRDGLHCTGFGAKRIAAKIIERLSAIWPNWAALPAQITLPTANGLASLGAAQPSIMSNSIFTPGTNGARLGTWGLAPLVADIPQGWTLFISGSGTGMSCVVEKGVESDPDGFPVFKLTISGMLAANSSCQIQVYQLASLATLFANGWLTINDRLRGVARMRVEAGAQYFSGASLSLIVQSPTTNKFLTGFTGRGGSVINMSTPAFLDCYDGSWLDYCTEVLDFQDPGKVALGQNMTAQSDISQIQIRADLDFRNLTAAAQNVFATVRLSRVGAMRVAA